MNRDGKESDNVAITVSNIEICSVPVSTDYYISGGNGVTDNRQYFSVLATDIYDVAGVNAEQTIFENDILRITAYHNSSGRPSMEYIYFYDKANNSIEASLQCNNLRHCYLALGYDDETQKAYFYCTGQFYYSGDWNVQSAQYYTPNGIYGVNGYTRMYELISGSQVPVIVPTTSNGGGATHIAKVTGQLKDLSSHLSDILIVSGGGGGGMLIGDTVYPGADAGGISGSGDNSADQSAGYAFGQGESGSDVSGGGGGLYGGYKGAAQ